MKLASMQGKGTGTFSPIFIVGAPRSGTTLLAVLLDRHPEVAIPPETQFFSEFLPGLPEPEAAVSAEQKVARALAFHRIKDLGLDRKDVLEIFRGYENTWPALFQTLLEAYCRGLGKKRPGEKTPKHIRHVPLLFELFPRARILCIVRDGRDVVGSLLKTPWAEPQNPRRFALFCTEWNDMATMTLKYRKRYSASRFRVVRYEDLVHAPEETLGGICDFLGIAMDPVQLRPTPTSPAVPHWEAQWKGKASGAPDAGRAGAWRHSPDWPMIWEMNVRMGRFLKQFAYGDTQLRDCPAFRKMWFHMKAVPYFPSVRPVSLCGLKLMRAFGIMR